MISLNQVALRRGPRKLLDNVTMTLSAGQRVGIVGRNGTGKSSLFSLILGEIDLDAGDLHVPAGLTIANVSQEITDRSRSALDYVLDGDPELRAIQRAVSEAEAAEDVQAIATAHEHMHAVDGYAAESRAARLLDGLGFDTEVIRNPVSAFSGGWQMRLHLGRALMCRSDLLLLDEPTNHLDLDAVFWLQDWLRAYSGTLLVISHDREFLDATTTHTVHLVGQTATLFTGNYSTFEATLVQQRMQHAAAYAAQEKQKAHLQTFVDRFKAKASKAKQAQSRVKQIERMQLAEPAHWDSPFSFEFPKPDRLPAPLIRLDRAAVGYGGTPVLSELKLDIHPGDRIGLLGRNGAGKSTLINLLCDGPVQSTGAVQRHDHLRIGYFAQHQVDQLDMDASPLLHLQRDAPKASTQALRSFLGGFDFRGDRVLEPVGPLSGGEKARLCLARIVYQQPNLLLLDEPTNHLDLDMRHALEVALQGFEGAMVLVSHDRHLVAATCDQLWLIAHGRQSEFSGDLDEYARWLRSRASDERRAPASPDKPAKAPLTDAQRKIVASQRRSLAKPMRQQLRRAEEAMAKLQRELGELDRLLADPSIYQDDPGRAERLGRKRQETGEALESAEAEWLEAAEVLEQPEP
ncbi:ABC-F family ATP-binding cassette domain-containing protein [Abyssibacter sp.]|uniref:ABC-F family ATP-binding cassette domain-containing protein n=1 Tax=Abyssibacter sp. TaxID=2320200 RepID=UPI0035178796